MKSAKIIFPAIALLVASCANQSGDDYDTAGYDTGDFGTPDGVPYQDVNPVYDSTPAYEDASPAPAPVTPRPVTPAPAPRSHTVVRGDTLWGLSRQYNVSVDAIKQANNMTRDIVVLGTTLVIPAP